MTARTVLDASKGYMKLAVLYVLPCVIDNNSVVVSKCKFQNYKFLYLEDTVEAFQACSRLLIIL